MGEGDPRRSGELHRVEDNARREEGNASGEEDNASREFESILRIKVPLISEFRSFQCTQEPKDDGSEGLSLTPSGLRAQPSPSHPTAPTSACPTGLACPCIQEFVR